MEIKKEGRQRVCKERKLSAEKWEIRDSGRIGHMKRRGKDKKVVKDKNEEKQKAPEG